jgi:hypothetical protein
VAALIAQLCRVIATLIVTVTTTARNMIQNISALSGPTRLQAPDLQRAAQP